MKQTSAFVSLAPLTSSSFSGRQPKCNINRNNNTENTNIFQNVRCTQSPRTSINDAIKANLDENNNDNNKTQLEINDPEMYELLMEEKMRQCKSLELIASENFTSPEVMECLGSIFTNKYSEGYPNKRYYGGNEIIDKVELLCIKRALKAFHLDENQWGCNVQSYSGSPANFAVYNALLNPHDRIMGLDLPSGGHLTHGYYTQKKKISATSIYFESLPYNIDIHTGLIDYEELEKRALIFKPKLLIAGGSAYSRDWDYNKFKQIANKIGAYLLIDMAHISGLVASSLCNNPFDYADVVTTTTHKSLRGPRSGMIFFKKSINEYINNPIPNIEEAINSSVFPSLQGGPHNHQIAALSTQLLQVQSNEFKQYSLQVVKNSKAFANKLMNLGIKLITDGTDNHLVLCDLRPFKFSGSKAQLLFDKLSITLNKNAVCGDKSAMNPGGIRLGTPALTTRGFKENDFEKVAELLHKGLQIGINIQTKTGPKLVDFIPALENNTEIEQLRQQVEAFALSFDMPGVSKEEMDSFSSL